MAKVTAETIGIDIQNSTAELKALINKILLRTHTPHGREAMGNILNKLESTPRGTVIEVLEVDRIIKRILNDYLTKFLTAQDAEIDAGTCRMIEDLILERSVMCTLSISSDRRAAFKEYKQKHRSYTRKQCKAQFKAECDEAERILSDNKSRIARLTGETSIYRLSALRYQREAEMSEIHKKVDALKAKFRAAADAREQQRLEREFQTLKGTQGRLNAELLKIIDNIYKINAQQNAETQVDSYADIIEASTYDAQKHAAASKKIRDENKRETEETKEAMDLADTVNASNERYADASGAAYTGASSLAAEVARDDAKRLTVEAGGGTLADLVAAETGLGETLSDKK